MNRAVEMWIVLIYSRIGSSNGLLRTWQWNFGFYKLRDISWLAESFSRRILIYEFRIRIRAEGAAFPRPLYLDLYLFSVSPHYLSHQQPSTLNKSDCHADRDLRII
jgi:hypothetical protein